MSSGDVNKLISQDIQCEDTYKEDKIKIAKRLVKNFFLLRELNLLSAIKNEEDKGRKVTNVYKEDITYDSENVIYANKYILNFLQLKEQKRKKEKEEEKRKTKLNTKSAQPHFFSENDITLINDTLYENDLSLSTYTEKIMTCDEKSNFHIFNDEVMVKHVHVPTYDVLNQSPHSEKTFQMVTLLIKSYNDSLNLIKLQQSVIKDFLFYTHNLVKNKQRLTRKNERLIKANSVNVRTKEKPQKGASVDVTPPLCSRVELGETQPVPSSSQGNLLPMYKTQIDLYRRHISHLYHENDHLKKHLNKCKVGPTTNH
ncbi:hypothetical protein C922_01772 [Plasmodium inui San Antonio 1]|uniref:Uncharacterized protein n=1 Tax=Plasmodium inui San Antonio 1 TaxID=1237626 RepID=W7A2Y9_9APIC|nr:hypothetical protein C922_01772 [Plasmodium inui San Antonio 1]EUD67587.1 hypothetical protein C922_01772 [Plasmodium inui San Antonio 1]